MISSKLTFDNNSTTLVSILDHLEKCSNLFNPPLDKVVSITDYSKKIFENACTFESWDRKKLVGLVAVYYNDMETKVGYITNVSVLSEYQGKGISSKLLRQAIEFGKKKNFTSVRLQVHHSNKKATMIYKNNGFITIGSETKMLIMEHSFEKNR